MTEGGTREAEEAGGMWFEKRAKRERKSKGGAGLHDGGKSVKSGDSRRVADSAKAERPGGGQGGKMAGAGRGAGGGKLSWRDMVRASAGVRGPSFTPTLLDGVTRALAVLVLY